MTDEDLRNATSFYRLRDGPHDQLSFKVASHVICMGLVSLCLTHFSLDQQDAVWCIQLVSNIFLIARQTFPGAARGTCGPGSNSLLGGKTPSTETVLHFPENFGKSGGVSPRLGGRAPGRRFNS